MSGGVVMCGGSAINWVSRTPNCVKLLTTEAEYVVMGGSDAVEGIIFITLFGFYHVKVLCDVR